MPAPRSTIVDETVTPWYHCISRCIRRAFPCGQGCEHRKRWIENRLKELVGVFAVECAGFAVLDNHLHVLVRLDSGQKRCQGRMALS
jgi:REP element-mobilizing transposase RayT